MAKITLDPIVGSYASVTALNKRFSQIEDAFNDGVLWRANPIGTVNTMTNDLDLNGYTLLNVTAFEADAKYLGAFATAPTTDNLGVTLSTVHSGYLYFNTTTPQMWVWNGSAWQTLSSAATSASAVTIADTSNNYTSSHVEGALEEISDRVTTLESGSGGGGGGGGQDDNAFGNGNFEIWQRGTSFTAPTSAFTADRMQSLIVGGGPFRHDVARSTDVPTYAESGCSSNYSFEATVNTTGTPAGTQYGAFQRSLEGPELAKAWIDGFFTVSFWVKSNKTGTYGVTFLESGGSSMSYVASYTISSADTWEKKILTIPLETTTGVWPKTIDTTAMYVYFYLGGVNVAGTQGAWHATVGTALHATGQANFYDNGANYIRFAQMKMEAGSSPTVLSPLSIVEDLAQCHRYCWKTYYYADAPGTVTVNGAGEFKVDSATSFRDRYTIPHPVSMVSTATATVYSTDGTAGSWYDVFGAGNVAISIARNTPYGTIINPNAAITVDRYLRGHVLVTSAY